MSVWYPLILIRFFFLILIVFPVQIKVRHIYAKMFDVQSIIDFLLPYKTLSQKFIKHDLPRQCCQAMIRSVLLEMV